MKGFDLQGIGGDSHDGVWGGFAHRGARDRSLPKNQTDVHDAGRPGSQALSRRRNKKVTKSRTRVDVSFPAGELEAVGAERCWERLWEQRSRGVTLQGTTLLLPTGLQKALVCSRVAQVRTKATPCEPHVVPG